MKKYQCEGNNSKNKCIVIKALFEFKYNFLFLANYKIAYKQERRNQNKILKETVI